MRRFILTVEILFLSLVLLGGSSVPLRNDTAVATKFRWEDHRTIAHALGGLAGKDYLNSREGFLAMYEQGVRLLNWIFPEHRTECGYAAITGRNPWGSGRAAGKSSYRETV